MVVQHYELLVPADPRSARSARRRAVDAMRAWNCGDTESAEIVISELVTNAIVHARTSMVRLCVDRHVDHLRIAVTDDSDIAPTRRTPTNGGFGLNIVAQLSTDWGWEPTGRGKFVWSDIPCTQSPSVGALTSRSAR